MPRVAVIIPCYEDGELAAGAVASVREREPVELVVVDDGSRDAPTLAALERLEAQGVRVIRHDDNRGLAQARTTGLHATSAPFVFPLDADDEAVAGVLAAMATRLENEPWADVCFGDYFEFGQLELVRAVPSELDPYRLAFTNEYPVSAMFRRSVLEAVDGWRPIDAYEDWHLWMTLAERGTRAIHLGPGHITYRRRLHGSRMLTAARRVHPQLYARLRREHAQLFDDLPAHRRRSTLSLQRKLLYPVVYGGRTRFAWEGRVKTLLDRAGVWTMRR
ncbi:MAG TPA: glycosyltransferase family 2 protein [Solirubrobacteraceae bacterium]|nr:glycosyltransferase family 2 protein [Solirubrobacteraceae bacterium]